MKSPVFNEMPLVLLASKLTGRPVKWISTRTEAFLSDAQARDNVTEAELALDKDGTFLALRVKTIAAIGAYLQNNMPAFFLNAGTLAGTYRTPAILRRHHRRLHQHQSGAPLSRQRPPGGRLTSSSAWSISPPTNSSIDPVELRRRNYIPPSAMPFKTGLTFTYDCGEFEKNMDLALELADFEGFKARKAQARKRGKLRGIGLSNTIERAAAARHRRRRSALRPLRRRRRMFSGSNSQGQGHETVFKQIVCDRLGIDPDDVHYVQGDTDQVFYGEGTGGSRSATMGGSAFHMAPATRSSTRRRAHRRACAQGRARRTQFRRRRVFLGKDQPHHDR